MKPSPLKHVSFNKGVVDVLRIAGLIFSDFREKTNLIEEASAHLGTPCVPIIQRGRIICGIRIIGIIATRTKIKNRVDVHPEFIAPVMHKVAVVSPENPEKPFFLP